MPKVKGLEEYMGIFPGRVRHSKTYRSPIIFKNQKILIIGNSASGHDLSTDLVSSAQLPVFQSRRSASRWDGDEPPHGIVWKPIISEYFPSGRISFVDGTCLDGIDIVIYCTGYLPSYPFWNEKHNGRPLWSYEKNRMLKAYQHTFFQDFRTLAIVGLPRVLTFRSFEYQSIALARLLSRRNQGDLPVVAAMNRWEQEREKERRESGKKFHDIEWETGETERWLEGFYKIAGLSRLSGEGRTPPVLGKEVRWAIEHLRKYPEPGKDGNEEDNSGQEREEANEWVLLKTCVGKDLLAFI